MQILRIVFCPHNESLEYMGAATCKLINFVDHKVLQKSFRSPSQLLSVVVSCSQLWYSCSKCDRQTNGHTKIWTSRAAVAAKKQIIENFMLCASILLSRHRALSVLTFKISSETVMNHIIINQSAPTVWLE